MKITNGNYVTIKFESDEIEHLRNILDKISEKKIGFTNEKLTKEELKMVQNIKDNI